MTASAGLHNMPAELRRAVVAEPGHVFVRADLGQIEPRVLAAVSGDQLLTRATVEPDLYAPIAAQLDQRGCLIPQTWQSHRPENVVHASFESSGSSDWAVLCSAHGTVSLLVFFGSAQAQPITLASTQETERLQPHGANGTLGFNWGIDRASPGRVHDAQAGLHRRPPAPDHDALADSTLERRTVYHFYAHNAWMLLETPE